MAHLAPWVPIGESNGAIDGLLARWPYAAAAIAVRVAAALAAIAGMCSCVSSTHIIAVYMHTDDVHHATRPSVCQCPAVGTAATRAGTAVDCASSYSAAGMTGVVGNNFQPSTGVGNYVLTYSMAGCNTTINVVIIASRKHY